MSERPSSDPACIRLWDCFLIDSHCFTLSGERSSGFIPYDPKDNQSPFSGDNRPPSWLFIVHKKHSSRLLRYDNNHTQMYIINYLPLCQMWFLILTQAVDFLISNGTASKYFCNFIAWMSKCMTISELTHLVYITIFYSKQTHRLAFNNTISSINRCNF
mgnify:CR=1 FL=1